MSLGNRKFTHNNEGFTCEYCGALVAPRQTSCRNHCPECLSSKHVDLSVGDRSNGCQGRMKAISFRYTGRKGIILTFSCLTCGHRGENVSAYEDPIQPDNFAKILSLSPASISPNLDLQSKPQYIKREA